MDIPAEIEIIVPDHLVADWAKVFARADREAFPALVKQNIVEGDVGAIIAVIDADGFSDFSSSPLER